MTVHVRYEPDREGASRAAGAAALRAAAIVTRRIATQAKMNTPVLTGNLRRSIDPSPPRLVGPGRASGSVEATAEYALYVHEGTRPHVIRPRNAAALHFHWKGREVFAKSVQHPGTRARPFLRNAAQDVAAGL